MPAPLALEPLDLNGFEFWHLKPLLLQDILTIPYLLRVDNSYSFMVICFKSKLSQKDRAMLTKMITALGPNDPDDGPEGRQRRGLGIAAVAHIEKNRLGYKVPSQSGNGSYVVTLDGDPFCSCPDFEKRQRACKHIRAVEFVIQREERADGTIVETQAMRVTSSQQWPAYNQAQRDEKREFMRLLSELCQTIPEPPQTFGRPRLPLSEMVFAVGLKVYSTVSGRRFMGDLDTAHEKGYISHVPHYNSVFNYLENPSLAPILKELIEASSTPLKSIESSFAVDSTGFSVSRFDRWIDEKYGKAKSQRQWLKVHAMVGTTTNVVTAVEVTPSNVHDSPMLAPLVESTAQRFDISEISADKAYSGKKNLHLIQAVGATPYIPFKSNATGHQGHHKFDNLWTQMYHFFMMERETFLAHYHLRSNVETTFSMIKSKFGDSIRSKTDVAQINELLLKVLCHNICCLILAMYEHGANLTFWAESQVAQKVCEN